MSTDFYMWHLMGITIAGTYVAIACGINVAVC